MRHDASSPRPRCSGARLLAILALMTAAAVVLPPTASAAGDGAAAALVAQAQPAPPAAGQGADPAATAAAARLQATADRLASPQPRPHLDWLRLDPKATQGYAVEPVEGDPARLTIRQTWSAPGPGTKAAMLLIPVKSVDAYSISLDAIVSTFRERGLPAIFHVWYFGGQQQVAREALDWATTQPVDLIMSVGSVATEWLHANYVGGAIPVVTSASKDPVLMGQMPGYDVGSGTNFAYTSINVPIPTQMAYLRRLLPEIQNIGVLYAENNRSAIETQVAPLEAVAGAEGFRLIKISARGETTADADLQANIPPAIGRMRETDPDLSRSLLLVTGSTTVYDRIGLINRLSGSVPVFATLPDVVRPGDDSAILSIGINQSSAVQLAAVYAVDILEGAAKPGDLKVGVVSPPDIAINFRRARAIGLKIPFAFLEAATFVYDYDGRPVRMHGQRVLTH